MVSQLSIRRIEVYKVCLDYKHRLRIASRSANRLHNAIAIGKHIGRRIHSIYTPGTSKIEKIVVKIAADSGIIGLGEASPSKRVTGENIDSVLRSVAKLAPDLIKRSYFDIEGNMRHLDSIVSDQPAAKACIDIALHDLVGKSSGQPVFMLFGGRKREVMTDFSIGIDLPEKMAESAAKAAAKGFRAIKIKVGGNPSEDLRRVELVREAIGNDLELRVDANEGWTTKQAINVMNKLERSDICFVEQPVKSFDLEGLAKVKRSSQIPIMADESVCSVEDARRLIQAEAADLINIKLMKSGGMLEAMKIAQTAENAKMNCMIGCMMETKIGVTAATHLASSIRNIVYADLDSDLLLEEKLVEGGASIQDSMRKLPEDPGLGITRLNESLLGKPVKVIA